MMLSGTATAIVDPSVNMLKDWITLETKKLKLEIEKLTPSVKDVSEMARDKVKKKFKEKIDENL